MKKVIVGKSKGIAEAEQCAIHVVMLSFWYSTVKWLILKPLVKLSYILNGRIMGKKKWYERHFTNPIRYRRLSRLTYKLTKYVMFK
jgi:hypothetical protein